MKMLRKSPTSNAWTAIFKNVYFSYSSLKVEKLSEKSIIVSVKPNKMFLENWGSGKKGVFLLK